MKIGLWACALACAVSLCAQVSVREEATKAKLVSGKTALAISMLNRADKPVTAKILLEWLAPDDRVQSFVNTTTQIPVGESTSVIAFGLPLESNPHNVRLRYTLIPASSNYTAFARSTGVLSFAHIADYVYALTVVAPGQLRPDSTYDLAVLATHVISGGPVAGVKITCEENTVQSGPDGVAHLNLKLPDDFDDGSIEVSGELGDVHGRGETHNLVISHDSVRIDTDKPIYQPGQTMHIRLLSLSAAGPVRANTEYKVKVLDQQSDAVHTATLKTSRFGIAATDWAIPANAPAGRYEIEVNADDLSDSERHPVFVRSYELPSFRVSVKPDKPFYRPKETVTLQVRGDFLFGKPLTGGTVDIKDGDTTLGSGTLDGTGQTLISFVPSQVSEYDLKYHDSHLVAFVIDSSTRRTEQRRFDIRVSEQPIHLYAVRSEIGPTGLRLYLSTSLADGTPIASDLHLSNEGTEVAAGKANRFGIARIDLASTDLRVFEVTATTASGLTATDRLTFSAAKKTLGFYTDHSLYAPGQSIRCRIVAKDAVDGALLLAYTEAGGIVYSRSVTLNKGVNELIIPYDRRFAKKLTIGIASARAANNASRVVLYPQSGSFRVHATAQRQVYRPGENATVELTASTESAFGIAIVDESVQERVAGDRAVRRRWFDFDDWDSSIGGYSESDLLELDSTRIDADLQLLAEALLNRKASIVTGDEADFQSPFKDEMRKQLKPLVTQINQHYTSTLRYPHTFSELSLAAPIFNLLRDSWLQPYGADFSTAQGYDVIRLISSGPDKRAGTADDIVVETIRHSWFAKQEAIIREALGTGQDFPASVGELAKLLETSGLLLAALKDPWGTPLKPSVKDVRDRRVVQMLSAGPDRRMGTADDFNVVGFYGSYFGATSNRIAQLVYNTAQFPKSPDEFRSVLAAGGLTFDDLHDFKGNRYLLNCRTDKRLRDNVQIYSYAEYEGVTEQRKLVTPVTDTIFTCSVDSAGEDGLPFTGDDFEVAAFSQTEKGFARQPDLKATGPNLTLGQGVISGTVKDQTGGGIPGARVVLNDAISTVSDAAGSFRLDTLTAGSYRLRCEATGFQSRVVAAIPVIDHKITQVDLVLQVGSVAETVEVSATASSIQMETALAAMISTPRVRDYFPETLYWQPELVGDSAGRARFTVKLADSVTTWKVAVLASTKDGRVAETVADIRAFQPFMAELDVPPVLTVGDEITLPVPVRNYLDVPQAVKLAEVLSPALSLAGQLRQPERIGPSLSQNALLPIRAERADRQAKIRVVATSSRAGDAIEKPTSIHPDGQRLEISTGAVIKDGNPLQLDGPADVVNGSLRAEVKLYPSLLARILETMESMLTRPTGCAEQTISSSFPNVQFLGILRKLKVNDPALQSRALRNLQAGYVKLLNYQHESGGFSYWKSYEPDIALTSYALNFLLEARQFIAVDPSVIARTSDWLAAQKNPDPSVQALQVDAAVLAKLDAVRLDLLMSELARAAAEFEDPYAMAVYVQAAINAGKPDAARKVMDRLAELARDNRGTAYWAAQTNTPFHSWGRSGDIETTSVVLSAIAQWLQATGKDQRLESLADRAVLFLLKNANPNGGWPTTQSSVRALDALLNTSKAFDLAPTTLQVLVNGARVTTVAVPKATAITSPITIDISNYFKTGRTNQVSLVGGANRPIQAQVNLSWFEPWKEAKPSPTLQFANECGPGQTTINAVVKCRVQISRIDSRGTGMLIAEIGLPPGAEVDRSTLQSVVDDRRKGVDSFEVAPDHVTFYVWPQTAGTEFSFAFRPRFAMKAQTAQSTLYDYYNPDEKAVLPPQLFTVVDENIKTAAALH